MARRVLYGAGNREREYVERLFRNRCCSILARPTEEGQQRCCQLDGTRIQLKETLGLSSRSNWKTLENQKRPLRHGKKTTTEAPITMDRQGVHKHSKGT